MEPPRFQQSIFYTPHKNPNAPINPGLLKTSLGLVVYPSWQEGRIQCSI